MRLLEYTIPYTECGNNYLCNMNYCSSTRPSLQFNSISLTIIFNGNNNASIHVDIH